MSTSLSVIICTHNRYATLADAIASIEIQDCMPEQFELIIVDNSSDLAAKKEFFAGLDITCRHQIIHEALPGLSRARNIGVRAARGEVVAFMDDDARASPQWVGQLITTFEKHPRAGIAGGPVRPIWPVARPSWLHPWLEGFLTILDRGPEVRVLEGDEWLAGTNIAFRRAPLIEAGLFNETLGRVGKLLLSNEELSVSSKLRKAGFVMLYDPALEMHHRVHADRINQAWMRQRAFWQVVSDKFAEAGDYPDFDSSITKILDYQMRLPPKERGLSGLFRDVDDPEMFEKQISAISTLAHLLATDGRDWRAYLDDKQW